MPSLNDRSCQWSLLLLLLIAFVRSVYSVAVSPTVLSAAVDLIDAGHILHLLDVVDAFGHVSVRNPDNSSQFLMSFSIAPALVTSQDLVTYDINNATAIQLTFNDSVTGSNVPNGFAERFVHSQIYKAFPDVLGVVHSHTTAVLPFAAANVPLRALILTAAFLGTEGTPIFDYSKLPTSILPANQIHDLLLKNEVLGDALVDTFRNDSQVVLMTGHGMVVRGISLRDAVFTAYYTMQDAIVQCQSMLLGGGKLSEGLTQAEAVGAETTIEGVIGRAWDLWVTQIDHVETYKNDLRPPPGS